MFGTALSIASGIMTQQEGQQQQQAAATAQHQEAQAAMMAQQQQQYMAQYSAAVRVSARYTPSTVERINGTWRCVIEAPTRIPQTPRQETHK